jgi:hypothetical protein
VHQGILNVQNCFEGPISASLQQSAQIRQSFGLFLYLEL